MANSPSSAFDVGDLPNVNGGIISASGALNRKPEQMFQEDEHIDPIGVSLPYYNNFDHQPQQASNLEQVRLSEHSKLQMLLLQEQQLQQQRQLHFEQLRFQNNNHNQQQQHQLNFQQKPEYFGYVPGSNLQNSTSTDSFQKDPQPSANSQTIFNFDMGGTSLGLLNDFQEPKPQTNDLPYHRFDFDLTNASLESIPDSLSNNPFELRQPQNIYVPNTRVQPSFNQSPYNNNTINDTFASSLSDASSFTPNSATEDYFLPVLAPTLKHLSSFSAFPPISKSSNSMNSKINKKSLSKINSSLENKKNLVISTNLANFTASSTPSADSPGFYGISPLCTKYRSFDISGNNPRQNIQMPTIIHHNSDSFPVKQQREHEETPRRKTYPLLNEFPVVENNASMNLSGYSTSEKPKKHTRRRLLPRSKNGCWICRIKHLKCDETRPVCMSCSKLGIECDYSVERPDYITDKELRKTKLASISVIRKLKPPNNSLGFTSDVIGDA